MGKYSSKVREIKIKILLRLNAIKEIKIFGKKKCAVLCLNLIKTFQYCQKRKISEVFWSVLELILIVLRTIFTLFLS